MSFFPTGRFLVGGERTNPLLVVFLSPDCGMCTTVAGHVRAITNSYAAGLDLLVVVQGTPRVVREFAETHELKAQLALRQNFPNDLAPNSTPYGLGVTKDGTVAARGVPNALEHLEEMIKIAEEGLPMTADAEPSRYQWGDALPVAQESHVDPQSQVIGQTTGQPTP